MEGMASVWGYQQSVEELQHTLLYTKLELESTVMAAKEEKRRNEEHVNQLLKLLNVAFQERDEAKNQLQRLLNKIMQSSSREPSCILPILQPESPSPIIPTKGNSSITESDSLSETYNRQSHVSSPVDSFFDGVSSNPSPDLSNINVADSSNIGLPNHPLLPEYNGTSSMGIISSEMSQIDPASAIIDQLAMKKPLPKKGKLLQAVMEAGPLLQTLLVAGPLPQWRNPPPVQSFQIPPVSIKGPEPTPILQKPIINPTFPVQSSTSMSCHENPNRASQVHSTAMLNFSSAVGPCMKKRAFLPSIGGNGLLVDQSLTGKCQRIQ
ncbi:uncharacterized protein LOC131253007 [Magnolia sinica]|uniref:uncharacterized protein LOC131253007 n=1 Tax=Magnolia sinica TaxID=86752 RepID=UPI0026581B63|nr:uncharacterized protein LOC131253007 [Magnolia sinica]